MGEPVAVHQIPREGLDHPSFAELPAGDHLIVELMFAARLDDLQFEKTDGILKRWIEATPWEQFGGQPTVHDSADSRIDVRLRLSDVARPVEPLRGLIAMYGELGVRFQELFAARWTVIGDSGVMGPIAAPGQPMTARMSFADQEEFMRCVFDHQGPPVASENPMLLKGAVQTRDHLALEQRGHILHVPGVRIGYGIDERYQRIAGDARTDAVEAALREALEKTLSTAWNYSFKPWVPLMSSFSREVGCVDTIVTMVDGKPRRGYEMRWFAESLRVLIRQGFRQREAEVMEALGQVIERLELDPVITWIRVGRPMGPVGPLAEPFKYFFQIWERPSDQLAAPEPVQPLDWPPQSTQSFYDQWLERKAGRFALRRRPRAEKSLLARIHNTTFAPDLERLLTLRDQRSLNSQVIGPLELDDGEIMLEGCEGNLVEALLEPRRQQFFRHTFAGLVPLGYLRQSQAEVTASVLPVPKERTPVLAISHRAGGFQVADGIDALLAAVEAMQRNDQQTGAALLEGRVSQDLELGWCGVATPVKNSGHSNRYFRAWWLFQLMGILDSQGMDQMVANMKDGQGGRVGYDKAMSAGSHLRSTGGMYLMWLQFFLKDPRLPTLLDACAAAESPLIADNAKLVRELHDGRKQVGPIEDIHARREEFLAAAEATAPEVLAVFRA